MPRTTLSNRILGLLLRAINSPNSRKLTNLEEETIVRYILKLDSRAFPPRRNTIKDIANRLLAKYNRGRVRKNWTSNFI